jgi:hypothetical protein
VRPVSDYDAILASNPTYVHTNPTQDKHTTVGRISASVIRHPTNKPHHNPNIHAT